MTTRVPTVIWPGSSRPFTRLAQANSAMVTRYGVAATCGMLESSAPTVSFGPTVTRVTELRSWVVAAGWLEFIADPQRVNFPPLIPAKAGIQFWVPAFAGTSGTSINPSHPPGVGLPAVFEILDEFLVVKATA